MQAITMIRLDDLLCTWTYPHTVRLDKETPARKAMKFMFSEKSNKTFQERKRATIYTSYHKS